MSTFKPAMIGVHVLLLATLGATSVEAQLNAVWSGGTGNWGDAAKWSNDPNVPHYFGYHVFIDNGNSASSVVSTGAHQSIGVDSLVIDSGDTLLIGNDTSFQIGVTFNNNGIASNRGTILLDGGQLIRIIGELDNAGGVISAINGSNAAIGARIVGGTLSAAGNSSITLEQGSSVRDLRLTGNIRTSESTAVGGAINNESVWSVTSNFAGGPALLNITSSVEFSGGGRVNMLDRFSRIYNQSTDVVTLTNVDNTIAGIGEIIADSDLRIVNESGGVFEANVMGHSVFDEMTLGFSHANDTPFINRGILRASNGGRLKLGGPYYFEDPSIVRTFDNAGGVIESLDGATVALELLTAIDGGTLRTEGSGQIDASRRAILKDVTNLGVVNAFSSSQGNLELQGTIDNRGFIQLGDGSDISSPSANFTDSGTISIRSEVVLTGGGTVSLGRFSFDSRINGSSNGKLINVDNTIRGSGRIDGSRWQFINQVGGTVVSDEPRWTGLTIAAPTTNLGTFLATNEAILAINGSMTNDGIMQADFGSLIKASGILTNAVGGSLIGNGVIESEFAIFNHGRIAPGNSVGALTLDSYVLMSATSELEIEVDDSGADLLTVSDSLDLGGDLVIDVLPGHRPLASELLQIVRLIADPTSGLIGSISGSFANVASGERLLTRDGKGSFRVTYAPDGIFLSHYVSTVPEPNAIGVLGAFAALNSSGRRKRGIGFHPF